MKKRAGEGIRLAFGALLLGTAAIMLVNALGAEDAGPFERETESTLSTTVAALARARAAAGEVDVLIDRGRRRNRVLLKYTAGKKDSGPPAGVPIPKPWEPSGKGAAGDPESEEFAPARRLAGLQDKERFFEWIGRKNLEYTGKRGEFKDSYRQLKKKADALKKRAGDGEIARCKEEIRGLETELTLQRDRLRSAEGNAQACLERARREDARWKPIDAKMKQANRRWRAHGCHERGISPEQLRERVRRFEAENPNVRVVPKKIGKRIVYRIWGIDGRSWQSLKDDVIRHYNAAGEQYRQHDNHRNTAKQAKGTIPSLEGVLATKRARLKDLLAQRKERDDAWKGTLEACRVLLTHVERLNRRLDRLLRTVRQVVHRLESSAETQAARMRIEQRIERIKSQIRLDQRAFEHLGLKKRARDFEDWAKLSARAKREFEIQTLEAFLSAAFTKAKVLNKADRIPDEKRLYKVIAKLKKADIKDPAIARKIRRLQTLRDKASMAQAVDVIIESLSKKKDLIFFAIDVDPKKPGKAAADAIIMYAKWRLSIPPAYQLLEADLKFATFALYNNITRRVSRHHIERLTHLTEEQLKNVKRLTELMHRHVKKLKEAKADLAALTESGK
jgi:hypothetical protein